MIKNNSLCFLYSLLILCNTLSCSGVLDSKSKTISGRVVDNISQKGISDISVTISDYKADFWNNNTLLGEAGKTISDSNGYFSCRISPREEANLWLLQFNSLTQDPTSPWYRDIAWYKIENNTYDLLDQSN